MLKRAQVFRISCNQLCSIVVRSGGKIDGKSYAGRRNKITVEARSDHGFDPTDEDTLDQLEQALDHLDEARQLIQSSGLADEPQFRAYALSELEGSGYGWLGDHFLIDMVRDTVEGARANVMRQRHPHTSPHSPDPRYPELTVIVESAGSSGNAHAVLMNVSKALRESGHASEVDGFMADATASDYDHLIAAAGRYVTVVTA